MLLIATLFSFFCSSYAVSSVWNTVSANIAVVAYHPVEGNATRREKVLGNTLQYWNQTLNAYKSHDTLDLIVFPESTLRADRETASTIVVGSDCAECEPSLRSIASLAKTLRTYIVVNTVEKSGDCTNSTSANCKTSGHRYYNTDVIFDRNGTIINRYRKFNLFGEYALDKPDRAEKVVFSTDFKVKFGIFTCFDILFKSPAQDLLDEKVDGVIFPSMWFSELPFLTAIQTQQMWAHEHNVTLFSAGANDLRSGSGGTAIFKGAQGRILGGYLGRNGTQTYVYNTTDAADSLSQNYEDIDTLSKKMDGFFLKREATIDNYATKVLNESVKNHLICYNGSKICCNFSVEISTQNSSKSANKYTYRLVAYSGLRSFDGVYNGGIDVCGIIACTGSTLGSCGQRFPDYGKVTWPITFNNITIVANFPIDENRTQFPNSLLSSLLPINANEIVWTQQPLTVDKKNVTERTISTSNQTHLLTFAIYGRNFALDSPPTTTHVNSVSTSEITYLLLSVSLFASLFVKI